MMHGSLKTCWCDRRALLKIQFRSKLEHIIVIASAARQSINSKHKSLILCIKSGLPRSAHNDDGGYFEALFTAK